MLASLLALASGDLAPLIVLIGLLVTVTIIAIAKLIYHWRVKALEADLKYEMIQRGMSADEIERVLAARIGPKGGDEK